MRNEPLLGKFRGRPVAAVAESAYRGRLRAVDLVVDDPPRLLLVPVAELDTDVDTSGWVMSYGQRALFDRLMADTAVLNRLGGGG